MAYISEPSELELGKITNCYISGNGVEETMFYVRKDGSVVANLDGFFIISGKKYYAINKENLSWFQKILLKVLPVLSLGEKKGATERTVC